MTFNQNTVIHNSSFCVRPFLQYSSFNDSFFRLCCSAQETEPRISTKNQPIPTFFNSDYLLKVRKDISEGTTRPECRTCYQQEKVGIESDRISANLEFYESYKNHIQKIVDKNYFVEAPVHLDLRLGNICNLKCQSCFPALSSGVSHERNLMSQKTGSQFQFEQNEVLPSGFSIEQIEPSLKHLEVLKFVGGEPMLSKELHPLLKILNEQKWSQNIDLSFHTNLTVFKPEILEFLKNFKSVKIALSIDGFGQMNDYLRYPSRWELVDKNLELYIDFFKDYKNIELALSPVIQLTNMCRISELLEYVLEKQKSSGILLKLFPIHLHNPSYSAAPIAPQKIKDIAQSNMESLMQKLSPKESLQLTPFFNYFRQCLGGAANKDLLKKFIVVTEEYDAHRKTDVRTIFPEFNLIKEFVDL